MRRSWLIPMMMVAAMCGIAQAAPPAPAAAATAATATDAAALEARMKALEKRVSDLEKQLSAAQAAAAAAPPAVRPTAPGAPATAPAPAAPPAPVVELWREGGAWSKLRRGMTWSQVRSLLGSPGSKTTGVFGDVWFYPDSSGGRVVFDRDSRVSEWTEPMGGK